jgi:DNA-binding NarL/FixJ family response regulator
VLDTHRPTSTSPVIHSSTVRGATSRSANTGSARSVAANGHQALQSPTGTPAGGAGAAGSADAGPLAGFTVHSAGSGANGSAGAPATVSGAPATVSGAPGTTRAPGLREAALAAKPVTVAVLAGDAITGQGAVAYLRTRADVKVLSVDRQHEAEVVLVIVDIVTEDTLKLIERAAEASTTGDTRFVLVGDGVREHHLLRVVTCGLVSLIPRREADFERVLRAIVDMREGWLQMPGDALGWLAGWLHAIQHEVLEPHGLTAAGLEKREVDVLRLLAEGLGTPEIAVKLNYSERTVKNIIHGVLTRLNLRNRTQAVAFAVRSGAL